MAFKREKVKGKTDVALLLVGTFLVRNGELGWGMGLGTDSKQEGGLLLGSVFG